MFVEKGVFSIVASCRSESSGRLFCFGFERNGVENALLSDNLCTLLRFTHICPTDHPRTRRLHLFYISKHLRHASPIERYIASNDRLFVRSSVSCTEASEKVRRLLFSLKGQFKLHALHRWSGNCPAWIVRSKFCSFQMYRKQFDTISHHKNRPNFSRKVFWENTPRTVVQPHLTSTEEHREKFSLRTIISRLQEMERDRSQTVCGRMLHW